MLLLLLPPLLPPLLLPPPLPPSHCCRCRLGPPRLRTLPQECPHERHFTQRFAVRRLACARAQ